MSIEITSPGVYDLPAEVYHRDPVPGGSLSQSGAKLLLPPSCPALYAYEQEHGRPGRRLSRHDAAPLRIGGAAHRLVLGAGAEIERVEADSWRTKAAQATGDAAEAAGRIPLLTAEHDQVLAMAAAVEQHPIAGPLFRPGSGRPEQSLFWRDQAHPDVWRRARPDWLPHPGSGRMILPEYKTAKSAARDAVERAIWDHGYHIQDAWYCDAVLALQLAGEVAFVLVVQEKTPPYLVHVVEPDAPAVRVGRLQARMAIDVYRQCRRTGRWPGYAEDVTLVSLPPWAQRQFTEETW
ncbi:MAG: PD-(D/E)XK nuclease-like domain-containing protein [Natronosporangium sp.]